VTAAAETPLFGAAAAGATGLIRVLARHGANLDQQDDCGETALIRACSRYRPGFQVGTLYCSGHAAGTG
jgi:ankyrin repeat protein